MLTKTKMQEIQDLKLQGYTKADIIRYYEAQGRNRHAYKLVFEYIETFYNTVRSHSHCGYLSPDQYEEAYYAALDEKAEALAG